MLFDDYIAYHQKYTSIYGEKMLVLMEVGSFFEYYATYTDGPNMVDICSILNIQSTRKNKSIPECSSSNPMMAGFPSQSLKKFIDLLLEEKYTIVLVEQVTPPPNPKRDVTQIISASTYLDKDEHTSTYLLCFYLSNGYDRIKKETYVCLSVSYMDATTGETFVYDQDYTGDTKTIIQEMTRIVSSLSPKEIVVCKDKDVSFSIPFHHMEPSIDIKPFQTLSFQTAILKKVYPHTGLLSPIEYIDLEKQANMVTSFVYLLNFAYEHNERIIQKLNKPNILHTFSFLRLTNTSIEQLNIISKPNQSSVVHVLNTCDTSLGKRYFKECLLSPLLDPVQIEDRYNHIEKMIQNNHFKTFRPYLQCIKDIERLFRRIEMMMLQPSEIPLIVKSLESVQHIQPLVDIPLESIDSFVSFFDRWDTNQNYKKGINDSIDQLDIAIQSIHTYFEKVVHDANKMDTFFKLEWNGQEYQITITKKRYEMYCERTKSPFTTQPFSSSNKTVLKVFFPEMQSKQNELNTLISDQQSIVKEQFMKDLKSLHSFSSLMTSIVLFVKQVDFYTTCAKNAVMYHYTRPTIESGSSFISAKKVRHPLIELVQKDIPYIPNDVELNTSQCGMLLYGINSAGKSSYMKSVGIALIMAQTGMYVPAESFTYCPYDSIYTRIPGGDNLFKGQSTFVAEISEVRSILKYATNRSLVIGDEVASGTESVSAISIVSAGITLLSQRSTSFIFATHLHEVASLDSILQLKNIGIFHISVRYDEELKVLIYDRHLKRGSGETMYGLEVCKSLDMPTDFLHLANTIRQEYLHMSKTIVTNKTSSYSSTVYVDTCSICNKKAEEVHHIKEQMLADTNGFIGSIHKNDPHNLLPICQTCHDRIHNGKIEVEGYTQTSHGKMLILQMKEQGKSIKTISKELQMTEYKIKKMLK